MPYWLGLCVLRRTWRQSSLYETLFHCNTLSKHHHHHHHTLFYHYHNEEMTNKQQISITITIKI
jgi:hypothetical protein